MANIRKENWLEFYRNLPSNTQVNDQMEQFSNLFSWQVPEVDFIRNLKENPGSFILAVDHFNNVILLHQVSVSGPSLFQPEQHILALAGPGASASFRIHPSTFSNPVEETPCPTWGHLKGATNSTEVKALVVPADASNKIKSKCAIVVPPLVALVALSSSTQVAEELIPLMIDAFKIFDQSSEIVKACTSLRHVVFYLWGVFQKKIPPITMAFDVSPTGSTWAAALHSSCIIAQIQDTSTTSSLVRSDRPQDSDHQIKAFSEISEILSSMRAASDKAKLKEGDDEDDRKDDTAGWKALPPLLQNMIIKASSVSDSTFPPGPSDSLLQILRNKKIIAIRTMMNVMLASANCNVNISVSLATAISSANLRSISPQVPHPFSCFNTPYHDASQLSTEDDIRMQLMASDGIGLDKATADFLSKENYKIPYSTHKLRHQLNNWQGLLQLVFGSDSLIAREAGRWVIHIDKLETTYDEQFKIDKDFGAKVCGLIDRSTYQFLGSCLSATSPNEVDWDLLSLENKRFEIQQNCFIANKPAFLILQKKADKEKDDDIEDVKEKHPKKPKKEGGPKDPTHLGAMITNTKRVQEWDCKKNYSAIFSKQVNRKTPPFNADGISACNKWHCQGYCFQDCARSITHKPFTDETLKKNYGDWVKELKRKFAEKP